MLERLRQLYRMRFRVARPAGELAHGQKIIGKVFALARNTTRAGTRAHNIANDITPER